MMPSDFSDTVESLPRREWERDVKCSNPWCDTKVPVRGEHCKACLESQERYRKAIKAHRASRIER
jgi:hypothetical protein